MRQILSVLLIVCVVAQPAAPLWAQAAPGVAITAMDRGAVRPFDRLVISGSGFTPATASISVLFVPRQRGKAIVIPVHSATATQVEVIVPPFVDPATGEFGFGQVDVQVMQVTSAHVMSSNVLSGLDVAPVPELPASLVTGRVTREFMKLSIDALATTTGSDALQSEQLAILAQIDAVVATPGSSASIPTVDSTPFNVTTQMLRASDRLIAAYLTSLSFYVRAQRVGDTNTTMADPPCPAGHDALVDLCALRVAVFGGGRNWLGGLVVFAAGVGAFAASAAVAAPLVTAGLVVAGAALITAGAYQLAYLASTSTLWMSLLSPDAPLMPNSVRDHSRAWLDEVNQMGAVPIPAASVKGADSIALLIRGQPSSGSSPQGLLAGAPSLDGASPTRDVVRFQPDVEPARLTIPSTPSPTSFEEARRAPAIVAVFEGSYAGKADLRAANPLIVPALGIPVAFTIAGGVVDVTAPFKGSGTVSPSGRIFLTLASCKITGYVAAKSATAAAFAGGSVECQLEDVKGGGPWSADRAAR